MNLLDQRIDQYQGAGHQALENRLGRLLANGHTVTGMVS
jgi:hypothetical protein